MTSATPPTSTTKFASDAVADAWQPDQYARFAAERRQPFDELVALCQSAEGGLVYDIGCGPGTLTAELIDKLNAGLVIGTDSSPAMLEKAEAVVAGLSPSHQGRLRFEAGDLRQFSAAEPASIIFSNAALQWVDQHDVVLESWHRQLAPGGQIAVQVPTNGDHPAYELARNLGHELTEWFPDGPPPLAPDTVGVPEWYAAVLHELGATAQTVRLQVFTHLLDSTSEVTEWIKGTSLNRYRIALGDARFDDFQREFTTRLLAQLGDQRPYLFTFKRILMWARF